MSEELKLAQGYRLRAEALRTLADMDDNRKTSDALKGVAKDYERIVETLELIDRTNRSMKRAAV